MRTKHLYLIITMVVVIGVIILAMPHAKTAGNYHHASHVQKSYHPTYHRASHFPKSFQRNWYQYDSVNHKNQRYTFTKNRIKTLSYNGSYWLTGHSKQLIKTNGKYYATKDWSSRKYRSIPYDRWNLKVKSVNGKRQVVLVHYLNGYWWAFTKHPIHHIIQGSY